MQKVSAKKDTTNSISHLLPAQKVSELLGVKVSTLSYWRCTGRYNLPYVKIGRLVMYKANDVNDFIQRRTVEGT
jgi:predicted DNA-binding transcriptional regulator AlpA